MANYSKSVSAHETLGASTVDVVTLSGSTVTGIVIINRTGTSEIYYTVNGATPTVAGDNTYVVPAAVGSMFHPGAELSGPVVKLISSGAMAYSVELV